MPLSPRTGTVHAPTHSPRAPWLARLAPLALATAISCGLALASPLHAQSAVSESVVQTLPPGATLVQTVEGITEYRLTNGLRILLAPDAADERVTVNVTYMVGSRHEGYGETGMAHLLEHLIFKGTPKTADPKAEFTKRGFNFNGTTTADRTNYFATFASSQANLEWYLAWQADAMVNSFIARKDLDSEMSVVRNEYERFESDGVQALLSRLGASAYLWHNYGKSTIGAKSDIENVDIGSLQGFYKRFYRPDNAFVIIAGKFDPTKTLTTIASAFGALSAPAIPLPKTYTVDTAQDGERSVVVRRPSTSQMLINAYHTPPALHPDTAPLQIVSQVLSDEPSGRLYKALVETKQALYVFGVPFGRREGSVMNFGAGLGVTDEAASRQKILLDIVESLATNPITQEEFDRAKAKINKNLELAFANAAAVANGAIESAVMGDWRSVFVSRDRMLAVTLADANRVAGTYFVASNRTAGHLIPTEKPARAPEPALANVEAYMAGFPLKAQGEASAVFDFSIENIQKVAGVTALDNGMKLSVLSKPVRGDVVTARIKLRFGNLTSLHNREAAAMMADGLLLRGTPKFNQQQIQDELVRLGAQVQFDLGTQGGSIAVTAKKATFPQALDFALHLAKNANFPEKDFDEIKSSWVKSIEGEIKDRSAQAESAFGRYGNLYPPSDLRYQHTLEEWLEVVKGVTRAQVRDFHAQFYGAAGAMIVVVGPVDAAAVQAQLTTQLKPWVAKQAYTRVPYPLVVKAPVRLSFDTPDKANASLRANLSLPLGQMDKEGWQLQLATQIFGGGPGSRLWIRLREKGGLSYSAGAGLSSGDYEKNASWGMSSDVAPANLSVAEAAMKAELARAIQDGFTQDEFNLFQKQWLAERATRRSGDGYAQNLLFYKQEFDRPWDLALRNDEMIKGFTLAEINAVWRKYLAPQQLVWGIFADQSKVK